MQFMFKVKFKMLPAKCLHYISISVNEHVYSTRASPYYFEHPICRTKIRERSISYQGPRLWDSLPDYLKYITSIYIFNKSITAYVISQYTSTN